MKKFIASIAMTLAVIGLGACGTTNKPVATKTVTASPSPSYGTDSVDDDQFGNFIKEHTDAFDDVDNATIADSARQVCKLWANGATLQDVAMIFIESGLDPQDSGYLVGAGTAAYCPQYTNKIKDGSIDTNTI